jgi:hypothetical protein
LAVPDQVSAPENVAVTAVLALSAIEHDPVPPHAPDQPVNVDPLSGMAVNITTVPLRKLAEQFVPQLIPLGEETTVPVPEPVFATVSVGDEGGGGGGGGDWIVRFTATVALLFDAVASATVIVPGYVPAVKPAGFTVTVHLTESPDPRGTIGPSSPNQVASWATE